MLTLTTKRSIFLLKKLITYLVNNCPKEKTSQHWFEHLCPPFKALFKETNFFLLIRKIFGMIQIIEIVKNIHSQKYTRIF
jgi:hypothetical protein